MHLQFQLKALTFLFLYRSQTLIITAPGSCLFNQYVAFLFLASPSYLIGLSSPPITFRHYFLFSQQNSYYVMHILIYLKYGIYYVDTVPYF